MKKIFCIFCSTFILVAAFFVAFPCVKVVSVSDRKNFSESIYSSEALEGFSISYTHSVNKGRIHDFYVCDGNQFVLKKSVFVSYGAGIPEPDEILDCDFRVLEDGFVLGNIDRRLDSFLLAVGVIAEHSITIDDYEYFLKNFFPVQTSLIFKIKRISVLRYLVGKQFNGGFNGK